MLFGLLYFTSLSPTPEINTGNITPSETASEAYANALDAPWWRGDVSIDSVRSPCKRHCLQRRPCGDHVRPRCVHTVSLRHCRKPHCTVTVLLLRTYGVVTALIQNAVGTPSHGARHAQSVRRGIASKETPLPPPAAPSTGWVTTMWGTMSSVCQSWGVETRGLGQEPHIW